MKPPPFDYAAPASLSDAVKLLAEGDGDAKLIAGGQSLMPMLAFRLAAPSLLVDLHNIPGLTAVQIDATGVRLGAMVRWRDIEDDMRLRMAHPLLVNAVSHVAHYQIRNRGTVGGSLAHADPAAELPGVVVACDARISVFGSSGARIIAAADFFTSALTTTLASDEIIIDVHLPAWPARRCWAFEEFSLRRGDFALAAVALFYDLDPNGAATGARICAVGVGDQPMRLVEAEALLNGSLVDAAAILRVAKAAAASVDPRDDLHASGAYRRALVETLTERALTRASAMEGQA